MNLLARRSVAFFSAFVFALLPVGTSLAQEDMAKQSQNPLGTIISSPFENTFLFGIGPSNATAYMLNWKPVYPVSLGSWNLINRFIVPVVYSEGQDEDVLLESTLNVGNASLTEMAAGSAFGKETTEIYELIIDKLFNSLTQNRLKNTEGGKISELINFKLKTLINVLPL